MRPADGWTPRRGGGPLWEGTGVGWWCRWRRAQGRRRRCRRATEGVRAAGAACGGTGVLAKLRAREVSLVLESPCLQAYADEHDQVRGIRYHDGRLVGVTVSEPQAAILLIQPLGDEPYTLKLVGMTRLAVTDFREGNIIHSMLLVPWERVGLHAGLAPQVQEQFGSPASDGASGRYVFVLVSSYGAGVLAVCDGLELGAP